MQALCKWIGRFAGVVGVVTLVLSLLARLGGAYRLGNFQVGTILQAAMAAMLLACLAYLIVLVEGRGR
jgi:hypothetical protein